MDYFCKNCEHICTAIDEEDIAERGKLCCLCDGADEKELARIKFNNSPEGKKWKSSTTLKREAPKKRKKSKCRVFQWGCNCCGYITTTSWGKPFSCEECYSRSLRNLGEVK